MSPICALLCTAALFVTPCTAGVIDGDSEKFPGLISSGITFVEFYAPWCTHCKTLAPELDKAADRLQGVANIVKVDATQNEALAKSYGVEGFPTLLLFQDGKVVPYKGGRTAIDIVNFIQKLLEPSFITLTTKKEVANFQKGKKLKLILYTHGNNLSGKEAFLSYANANRDAFSYAVVSDTTLFENRSSDFIEMHKPFDNKKSTLEDVTEDSLTEWLRLESFRLFDEIGPTNYNAYMKRGLPMAWLFIEGLQKESKEAMEFVRRVSSDFKGKLSFVYLDVNKFAALAEQFGLHDRAYPAFIIVNAQQETFRLPRAEITAGSQLRSFCSDFLEGKLSKTMKSQPRPEGDRDGDLTIVVGSSFPELVENAPNDILIVFTAPWCTHCKALHPVLLEIAADCRENPHISIATLDVSKNDVDSEKFLISRLPGIYFQPKGSKPVSYEGERTKQSILDFIARHKTEVNERDEV
ncbi:protein disulfide isomerase protein [Perkinsela sp. CCAP 1560/4]|nr:protein disulfide isomerase protein [Perkinsela sp. CCAP 1560/4]|eukprot:KNH06362.1 protein disulfide isomerase protein [Perkinsela sp. CCAP 1560/4]